MLSLFSNSCSNALCVVTRSVRLTSSSPYSSLSTRLSRKHADNTQSNVRKWFIDYWWNSQLLQFTYCSTGIGEYLSRKIVSISNHILTVFMPASLPHAQSFTFMWRLDNFWPVYWLSIEFLSRILVHFKFRCLWSFLIIYHSVKVRGKI